MRGPLPVIWNLPAASGCGQAPLGAPRLFAGSDAGGETAARLYSLIGSCRLNAIDPHLYLRHVLECIASHPINRIEELLPWRLASIGDLESRRANLIWPGADRQGSSPLPVEPYEILLDAVAKPLITDPEVAAEATA